MSMKRWKMTIEYDGSAYSGWQTQLDLQPTIQASIETAITKFCQQKVPIQGAGRTDSGVHAKAQIAHFDLEYKNPDITGFELAKAINAHLYPQPITILNIEEVDSEFHARFGAKTKTYIYRIVSRQFPLTLDRGTAWHVRFPLDAQKMQEGALHLLGKHDFSSFRDSECQAKNPVRTLDKIEVIERKYDAFGGVEICLHVQAQSFLHHQVRNIAGTLKLVGEGKWQPDDVKHALMALDRTKSGPTAPAQGLWLADIQYGIE